MEIDNFIFYKKENDIDLNVYERNFDKNECKIYFQNIIQKKQNKILLSFVYLGESFSFTNFGFSTDMKNMLTMTFRHNIIISIFEAENFFMKESIEIFQENVISRSNEYFLLNLKETFFASDKRNFIKKLFGNLSFLNLNHNTNTLFQNSKNGSIFIPSLDRKNFLYLVIDKAHSDDKNTTNKYKIFHYTLDEILTDICGNKEEDNNQENSFKLDLNINQISFGKNYYLKIEEGFFYVIIYQKGKKLNDKIIILPFILGYSGEINFVIEKVKTINFTSFHKENSAILYCKTGFLTINKIKQKFFIFAISFDNEYFEIIIFNSTLNVFKRITSTQFVQHIKTKEIQKFFVTDIFIKEEMNLGFIILNFKLIFVINICSMSAVLFGSDRENIFCINLDKIFSREYNKCLYIMCSIKDYKYSVVFFTKKEIKRICFKNEKIILDKKVNRNFSMNFYESPLRDSTAIAQYYFSLFLFNNFSLTNLRSIPLEIYLGITYKNIEIIKTLLQEEKNFNLINVINYKSHSGILSRYFPLKFTTYYPDLFVKHFNFQNVKSISPIDNKKNVICIYNCFFAKYIIMYLIKETIMKNINKKGIYKILKGLFSKEERISILSKIKEICEIKTKTNPVSNAMKFNLAEKLRKAFKHKKLESFFNIITKNIQYKDTQKIINFFIELLPLYCLNDELQYFYFNKFFLNDLIIDLEEEKNITSIIKKYFTKTKKKTINFDKEENKFLLCILLIIINKKYLIFENKDLLFKNDNQIKLIYLLKRILKNFQNNQAIPKEKIFFSQKEILSNTIAGNLVFYDIISQSLFQSILRCDLFKKVDDKNALYFFLSVAEFDFCKENFENLIEGFLRNVNITLNSNIVQIIKDWSSSKFLTSQYFLKERNKSHLNTFEISFNNFFDQIIHLNYLSFANKLTNETFKKIYNTIYVSFGLISYILQRSSQGGKLLTYLFKIKQQISKPKLKILSIHLKNFIINLLQILEIWNVIYVLNKKIISKKEQLLMMTSLEQLSFYFLTLSPDNPILFMKDILESLNNLLQKEEIVDSKFTSTFFLYGSFNFGNNDLQEKIKQIQTKLTNNKNNGNLNSLLNLNKKKENFLHEGIKSSIKNYDIFNFIQQIDIDFDFILKSFIANISKEENFKNSLNQRKAEFSLSYEEEAKEEYLRIDSLLNFKKFFSESNLYTYYDPENKEEKVKAKAHKKIEEILSRTSYEFLKDKLKEEEKSDDAYETVQNINDITNDKVSTINNDNTVYENDQLNENSEMILNSKDVEIKTENITIELEKPQTFDSSHKKTYFSSNAPVVYSQKEPHQIKQFKKLTETELKCKYISLKLLMKFYKDKNYESKNKIFRTLKARFYYNTLNKISRQVVDVKLEKNKKTNKINTENVFHILGRELYPKLKIKK